MAGEEPNDARPRPDAEGPRDAAPQDARPAPPAPSPQDARPGPDLAKRPADASPAPTPQDARPGADLGKRPADAPPAPTPDDSGRTIMMRPARRPDASGAGTEPEPEPGGAFGQAGSGGGTGSAPAGAFGPAGTGGGTGSAPAEGTGSAPAGAFGPAGSGGGTSASETGSFRLPAPGPAPASAQAAGPAPWEAPQNGGTHGAPQPASATGPTGPTGPAGPTGPTGSAGPPPVSGGGFGPPTGGGGYAGGGQYGGGGYGAGAAPGQVPAAAPGWAGAGTLPPPPPAPPGGPGPGGGPRGEARPLQALLIALLNLSCLGLGYLVLRHWVSAALCWAATAGLLLVALPADADGVPTALLVGYGAFLLAVAADGARRGLRARISWGTTVRRLALPLAVVLLAAPVGGAVAYAGAHADAREEARQQALLARLAAADALVKGGEGQPFATAEADYRKALGEYQDLTRTEGGSRAAKLVPDRLDAYYTTVSAPYAQKKYCEAVAPLKHLRSLPGTVDKELLADRPARMDEPLAQSLYECGAVALKGSAKSEATAGFNDLTSTFPQSPYVGKAETAVKDAIRATAGALGAAGAGRCDTTEELRSLRGVATGMKGVSLGGAVAEADRGVRKGVFACGTEQFGDKEFAKATETMNTYVKDYPDGEQVGHARSIAIAAQIAGQEPEAGKKLPPVTVPGGARMTMVISNDARDSVELLYTGPVTGKVTLKGCGGCRSYERIETLRPGFKPCSGAASKYPKVTIQLPAGTYHMLQKRAGSGFSTAGDTKTSKAKIESGYDYTNCLYVTSGLY
ncbi:hypothetical protein ACIGHB_21250 [Streptomyces sp. NPDC085460]|uniref:hypothetical protein n=1 Tax=Streptomyces sp. NPDC085460 TaxID=3365723 RepID=UPI0037D32802